MYHRTVINETLVTTHPAAQIMVVTIKIRAIVHPPFLFFVLTNKFSVSKNSLLKYSIFQRMSIIFTTFFFVLEIFIDKTITSIYILIKRREKNE
jgi:hypothetical protein|nr:MAG TPA: hypothetical protein [Caudoviricetes sp.]